MRAQSGTRVQRSGDLASALGPSRVTRASSRVRKPHRRRGARYRILTAVTGFSNGGGRAGRARELAAELHVAAIEHEEANSLARSTGDIVLNTIRYRIYAMAMEIREWTT